MAMWRRPKWAGKGTLRRQRTPLKEGLKLLNERLGNSPTQHHRRPARTKVFPTADIPRSIFYAPDMDGQAEPGEVVWFYVPATPLRERSMLVVGRDRQDVLGLLISSNDDHADDDAWLPIGSGEWKTTGEPCWVRLDKTLAIPETDLRRRGALFPPRRFDRIADHLRKHFDWA